DKKELEQWPIFRLGQFKGGVLFEKVDKRTYPFKNLAKRTVGFVNANGEGAGIERSFDKELAGIDGRALYQKIAGGDWKPVRNSARIRPVDGFDVYTTLNVNMQDVAHQALEKALIQHDANFGCVVIMEVNSGEIKAMVNLDRVKAGVYRENYNYALDDEGSLDPGSTFKTPSMMALLEDTTLTLSDTIETGGGTYRYYDRVMRDTRSGGWGRLTLNEAFIYSSNIGVSRLISRHFGQMKRNPDLYVNYIHKFGLGEALTSLHMAGIAKPYIKNTTDNTWSGVSLPWMSIGYELKVSPLQLLTFYNAIANDGYAMAPYLVRKITNAGEVIKEYKSQKSTTPICSPETLLKMKILLRGVVERGTAKNINTKKYSISGKTGTSQKIDTRGRYIKKYKASFAGFFPSDEPKYSMIVVIDEPRGAEQYGGDVSAPVFRRIADQLYKMDVDIQTKDIPRETPLYMTNLPRNEVGSVDDIIQISQELGISTQPKTENEWVSPVPRRYAVQWRELKIQHGTIPNVKGMTFRDALYLLENKGLEVFYSGKGRVKTQSLMPGSPLRRGDKIVINLE
ncbi:MAG: penicillin-binding protein, partial [Bacteroidota bacterium]